MLGDELVKAVADDGPSGPSKNVSNEEKAQPKGSRNSKVSYGITRVERNASLRFDLNH
jgi:hypothetical protein